MTYNPDGVFGSALHHRRAIDEMELINLAPEVDLNISTGKALNKRFRELMEEAAENPDLPARFLEFYTAGTEHNALIADQLQRGAIAAVDGTDRLSPMIFSGTQLYVAGVSWVTSQQRGTPEMFLTSTTADLSAAAIDSKEDDLWRVAEAMDRANKEGSWATTMREYCERECAYNLHNNVETCLIDGPFFTQNMLTQAGARPLLEQMVRQDRRYIGVIKGLDSSWALSRFAALSLRPGEVYILGTIQQAFTERLARGGGGGAEIMGRWLSDNASTYVRGVFRPKGKAFAFECAIDDIEYTVALLRADASQQVNHEIPRLLQVVDAACRRSNNSNQIKQLLLSQIQRRSPDMASNLSNERDSR